jgi:hypothetical protein
LHFEVIFESPVIFIAEPTNDRCPTPNRPIHYVDGSSDSYKATRVRLRSVEKVIDREAAARVHTTDDDPTSWVTLLSLLQREEAEPRDWDDRARCANPQTAMARAPEYRLAVGLQSKIRSWDFMPAGINKLSAFVS